MTYHFGCISHKGSVGILGPPGDSGSKGETVSKRYPSQKSNMILEKHNSSCIDTTVHASNML